MYGIPAYITGSLDPILKKSTAGSANTPYSLDICLSSIFTKLIPAPSASSSMCSISASTLGHCLQSLLSKTCKMCKWIVLNKNISESKRYKKNNSQKNTAT